MVLIVFLQFGVSVVFLPFAALPGTVAWNHYFAPILVAIAATILSFTRYKFLAATLAAYVALLAIGDWLSVPSIWRGQETLSFLVPGVCLAFAGALRWLMEEYESAYEGSMKNPDA